ncbi:MAG: hypothetical protein D6736_05775, partial [Nitrospinota bacterium]
MKGILNIQGRRKKLCNRQACVKGAVVLCLLAFFLQAALSMRQKSVTFDETYHLISGYTYLQTGDFRLGIDHPPLLRILAALPLLWLN